MHINVYFTDSPCGSSTVPADPCSSSSFAPGNMAVIKASSGDITSPNYPNNYPDQRYCRYSIDVSGEIVNGCDHCFNHPGR